METPFFLAPHRILIDVRTTSRRQTFQYLARTIAASVPASETEVVEILSQREKLGSTGIGGGIAIPHSKLPGITEPIGAFARLASPVDFDAIDDQPVDIVVMLLAPETSESDHLKSLARLARILRNDEVCKELRTTGDRNRIYELLSANI